MKTIFKFFLFSLLTFNLSAQDGWFNVLNDPVGNLSDVVFVSQSKGFVANELGTILWATEDEGVSWNGLAFPFWATFDLFFIDSTTGWVADPHVLGKTTDSGENWSTIFSEDDWVANTVFFTTPLTGYATGRKQIYNPFPGVEFLFISKSTDGGESWSYVYQDTITNIPKEYSSICFINDSTGWVVGREGTYHEKLLIKKTTNGGVTWDTSSIPNNPIQDYVLPGVFFVSETEGWIAVHNRIIHTTDGGTTWNKQYSDTSNYIYSIFFIDSLRGWVCGSNGTILNTEDGGENWTQQITNETGIFVDIYFTSTTHGWAITFNNVYHTTTGGKTFVSVDDEETVPDKFQLMQNYPNPFNPSTKIKFTIPTPPVSSPLVKGRTKEGFVTLIVYDVLGNEIATLVEEYKPAGKYEVTFSVETIQQIAPTSGVYFYQLLVSDLQSKDGKVGDTFNQTKKMILLK